MPCKKQPVLNTNMAHSEGSEADYERMAGNVYMYGNVALALAMARETGMVAVLCQSKEPMSSTDIANSAKLKERYVREVLNALTVAGFVRLEEGTGGKDGREARYWVPPACHPALNKAAVFSSFVSDCAKRYSGVRKCFDQDGPNGFIYTPEESESNDEWAFLDDWAAVMTDSVIKAMLETPGLKQRLESGIQAVEVGCGTGILSCRLAAMFPKSHFTVTDLEDESVKRAQERAQQDGVTNVTFRALDICQVPDDFNEAFNWVVAQNVIHGLPDTVKGLQNICRMLKPGGQFSFVDEFIASHVSGNLGSKDAAAMYVLGTFLFIPEAYQRGDSQIQKSCCGIEEASEMAGRAGMKVVGVTRSQNEGSVNVLMCQKPEQLGQAAHRS